MMELTQYAIEQSYTRLRKSKVTFNQFNALMILMHQPDGSSKGLPKDTRTFFIRGPATAAGYLERKGLVNSHEIMLEKPKCPKTVYTINDRGREFYNYIITGEMGPLMQKAVKAANSRARRKKAKIKNRRRK